MSDTARRASDQDPLAFLLGGGEMAERIRAFDWSKTPLGPPESWSPALRTTLRIVLANRFPHILWWSPHHIQFYNDAYRPIPGTKHPDKALGQPAAECWEEIWHVIGPLIDTPFHGGPPTWNDDICLEVHRHGFIEETHFTIAYSPVPDETVPSGIGGVLGTIHEITDKVVGERRVVALRDLSARIGDAKTAEEACVIAAQTLATHSRDIPFALLYLIDADGKRAHLAGASGVAMGETISPTTIDLSQDASVWPLREAQRRDALVTVEHLPQRFSLLPPGPWADPPQVAAVLPIRSNRVHEPAGLLVAGISSRLKFDALYQGFLELVATQVASAIANARAYEEERKRAEALAEIDRVKTAFFTNISHEFRTPLTLMLGPLEDALSSAHGELPKGAAESLGVAHRNSLRLLKLVNTLLDFSRIEAGRVQASYVPIHIAAYTAELASVFRAAIERAGMRLIVDCPPLPEPVYVDRDMWEKIVLNLLSNAFKYTLEGEIEVRMALVDGHAQLTVRDTGVGIPPDEMPRMFERFHRGKDSRGRTHEGTGIGLALVQELVKLHGGTVGVESAVGAGSKFTVAVPLGKAHLDPQRIARAQELAPTTIGSNAFVEEALRWLPNALREQEAELVRANQPLHASYDTGATAGDAGERGAQRPRILWADDNADMRAYVSGLLGERYEVEAVADGRAALEAVRRKMPDLVLSDVMMPALDGFELLRTLRADIATAEIPVILLSARAGEESRIEGVGAGADDYLIKPFGARELVARVDSHIKIGRVRRRTTQTLRESEKRLADEAAALARLNVASSRLWRMPTLREGLEEMLGATIELMGADMGNIQILDANRKVLRIAAQRGFEQDFLEFFGEVSAEDDSACGKALRSRERIIIEDVEADTVFAPMRSIARAAGFRAVQSTPVIGHDGAALGMISTHFRSPHRPGEQELRWLDMYVRQAADFIERKRVEAATGLLSSIVDSSEDAIISKDLDGVITSWNEAAERTFGYTASEAVGQRITMLIPPDRLSEELDIIQRLKCGERVEHFETIRVRKDRLPLNISLTISPIRDADGRIIGASKVARDITERKRIEAALQEHREHLETLVGKLRYRTAQFETLLNQAPLGVFLVDADFRIREVNPIALSSFGDVLGGVVGRDFDDIIHTLWDKPYADEIVRIFRHTLATGEPYVTLERAEYRIDRGITEYYEWRLDRILLADGRSGVVCYFRDISAQVLSRQAIEESREALREADRRKDEFLAMLAHELRNPLAPIRNALELMKLGSGDTEIVQQARTIMQRQVEQMVRLVDDLLDVSRISRGMVALQKERVQLAAVVRSAVETSRPVIESSGHALTLDVPSESIFVDADQTRLSQVFTNLLNNAAKYTERGGRIRLTVERRESEAFVTVADNGRGIPAHMLRKVFDMFTQGDRSLDNWKPGLGVGLSIAKQMIELHGGSIEARSAGHGMGSQFIVRVPVVLSLVGEQPSPAANEQIGARPGQRVLVVDDNADAALSMAMMLKLSGYVTQTAHDGLEALDVANAFRPDVVLLDIGMPKLDGYETCRRLRELPWGRSMTMVALTGWGQEVDRRASQEAGFDLHLVKPADPATLERLLASVRTAAA